MSRTMVSDAQRSLFGALRDCGELIFACGHDGITANIVGEFYIQRVKDEDRLVVGDGTQHVHIDWDNVRRVEIGDFYGEGMLTFFDGDTRLFKLYRVEGQYPEHVVVLCGSLV